MRHRPQKLISFEIERLERQNKIFVKINWRLLFKNWELSTPTWCGTKKKVVNNEDFEKENKLAEEQKQKEMEERKQRKKEQRQEIASKNKELKWIKKAEKEKANEKKMWSKLQELINNFAKMKQHKQLNNKKKKIQLYS